MLPSPLHQPLLIHVYAHVNAVRKRAKGSLGLRLHHSVVMLAMPLIAIPSMYLTWSLPVVQRVEKQHS